MFEILKKTQYSDTVYKYRVVAPAMARKAQAGQFLMIRINEEGERVPFTFADWSSEEGWIEFIFMVIGATTQELAQLEVGDTILDITGPLGQPTEMKKQRWAVIGGGVGLAIAYPVARALCEMGSEVSVIMGARTKDLLILQRQFEELPLKHLLITTDDGSAGEQGVVTAPLERLCADGVLDEVFAVGPVPMMKFSALTCNKYNVAIVASLNPIMVDGTGMCGCCRVTIGGETKFACVDGPDFDGSKVDWDDLCARQGSYRAEEAKATQYARAHHGEGCTCQS